MTICGSDVQCLRDRRLLVSNAFFYEQEYQQTGAYVFRTIPISMSRFDDRLDLA
jgi:hypothetical protein